MKKFTVVLTVPEEITDGNVEFTSGHVMATCPEQATNQARLEAAKAHAYDGCLKEYGLVCVFEGHLENLTAHTEEPEDTPDEKLDLINDLGSLVYANGDGCWNQRHIGSDLAFLMWAIADDGVYDASCHPDGLLKILVDHDKELLGNLVAKGYLVYGLGESTDV